METTTIYDEVQKKMIKKSKDKKATTQEHEDASCLDGN